MLSYNWLARANQYLRRMVSESLLSWGKGMFMMPLILANAGEDNIIKKVGGSPEIRKHLEDLGFVAGGNVKIISEIGGNLIVNVKESRVAISREMAGKIMI